MVSEVREALTLANPPQMLTEQVFNAGLRTYLSAFVYSTTTEDDLFFHLEVICTIHCCHIFPFQRQLPQPLGSGQRQGDPRAALERA